MATTSDIIFTIGSKMGPGGLASLKAGIDMVSALGKAIIDNIDELERFSEMWGKTNQQAVINAQNATKGLIETSKLIENYNRLSTAGVKITEEQFKTLAVRAMELSKATGEDATAALDNLTNALSMGSSKALKAYGIELKDTSSLQEKQRLGVEALTKGYENLTTELDSGADLVSAISNNFKTMQGVMFDAAGRADALNGYLGDLNDSMLTFNTLFEEAPNAMSNFIFSLKGLKGFLAENAAQMIEWLQQITNPSGLFALTSLLPGMENVPKGKSKGDDWKQNLGDISASYWDETYQNMSLEKQQREASGVGKGTKTTPRVLTGTGGKKEKSTDPEFNYYDAIRANTDEKLAALQAVAEYNDEQAQKELELEKEKQEAYENTTAFKLAQYDNDVWVAEQKQELHDQELLRIEEEQLLRETMGGRQLTNTEKLFGAEQRLSDAGLKMWKSSTAAKLDMMASIFGNLSSLMQSHSQTAFKIGKAAAITETIMSTASGAMKAYSSFAGLGPWGVALGVIAAAAVVAAGAVKLGEIRRTQFDAGGSGGGSVSPISTANISASASTPASSSVSSSVPGYAPTASEEAKQIEVNIYLRDDAKDKFFADIVDQNYKARIDGRAGFEPTKRAA